jgi:hypothetical protein
VRRLRPPAPEKIASLRNNPLRRERNVARPALAKRLRKEILRAPNAQVLDFIGIEARRIALNRVISMS